MCMSLHLSTLKVNSHSFDRAISAVCSELPALLQTLRHLKSDPSCYGLLKKFQKAKKVGTMYILNAVLPILSELSKTFQQGTVHFARIEPALNACNDKLQQLATSKAPVNQLQEDLRPEGALFLAGIECKEKYITHLEKLVADYTQALTENIKKRFAKVVPVLSAMQMLDPTLLPNKYDTDFQLYGQQDVNTFSTHFLENEDDAKQLQAEWNNFKYELSAWHIPQLVHNAKQAPVEWVLTQLRKQSYSYRGPYPLLMKVVEALIVIPVSNAWPERGASKVKLIKNRLRSRLNSDMLNALMQVSVNGPATCESHHLIRECVKVWLDKKPRKKLPRALEPRAMAEASTSSTSNLVEHICAATQTVTEEATEQQQVNLALDCFGLRNNGQSEVDDESDSSSGSSCGD